MPPRSPHYILLDCSAATRALADVHRAAKLIEAGLAGSLLTARTRPDVRAQAGSVRSPLYPAGSPKNAERAMTRQSTLENIQAGLSTSEVAQALGIDRATSAAAEIDPAQVMRVARHLSSHAEFLSFAPARWDDPLFWDSTDSVEDRSQMFAIGNAINFRFWQLDGTAVTRASGTIEGHAYGGAMYMWRSLRRSLERSDMAILDASFLAQISTHEFDLIFSDDDGVNPLAVAREERVSNLRDLGNRLLSDWGGSFYRVAAASEGSLVRFACLASSFRAFDDPLYKLTMVNAIMHAGSGVYPFDDDPLPGIDYHLLRHALRQGLLRPSRDIALKLRNGGLLDRHEAYELRRLALLAFVEISEQSGISGEVLDNKYWLNRVNCTDVDPVCIHAADADRCPFLAACARVTDFGMPLELTRYY
jgi:hypothetical protein